MLHLLRQILRTGIRTDAYPAPDDTMRVRAAQFEAAVLKRFGRAAAIRHVDAGSCNACELEINALNNPYYNLEGLGIHFVASPRHADILLVTGPVSRHMETALKRTYDAMPEPKFVVAAGRCAGDGGVFGTSYACLGGVGDVIPIDVLVPGCPPTPEDLMRGILAAIAPGQGKTAFGSAPTEEGTNGLSPLENLHAHGG
ncbi:MAG: NADH-quinone oxidoreductase subunit B family protein [Betaproteobacteria bacterium]|nr:NADH-quinone oxidoreductase subunit B family protein [Betaproteobacteria bacterium]